MPSSRSTLAALASAAVVIAVGPLAAPATADTAGGGLVISGVYGAGGNAGAVYDADYVSSSTTRPTPRSASPATTSTTARRPAAAAAPRRS
jgi:hypothetical protein